MSTITLSSTVNKNYTLIDTNHKYYLQTWYDDGEYQKQLNLLSIHEGQIESIRPYALSIENVANLKNILKTIAPIDMRVFLDGIEVNDNDKKAEIFASLIIFEWKNETTSILKSMNDTAVKAAKEESVLRAQINGMLTSMTRNITGLTVTKCKKLKNALKEIHGS